MSLRFTTVLVAFLLAVSACASGSAEGTTTPADVTTAMSCVESTEFIVDSLDKVVRLLGLAEVATLAFDADALGDIHTEGYELLIEVKAADVHSDVDEVRDLFADALELYRNAFRLAQRGVATLDVTEIDQATDLLLEGNLILDQANEAVDAISEC